MSLPFLGTARLSATPLARHIDTPKPRVVPQFRTQEEYAAAMMADAKGMNTNRTACRKRYSEIEPTPIIDAIRENPGITARGIADLLEMNIRQVSSKLCHLENRGAVRSILVSNGKGRVRSFSIGDGQYHRKPKQTVQDVIDFIVANPRCTTADLAARFKCSRKSASERVRAARKWVNIKTEGGQGNMPSRFSVVEDAQ